jgi:hypothetical protein
VPGRAVSLVDSATGKELRRLPGQQIGSVFAPDGLLVTEHYEPPRLGIWRVATGEEVRRFQVPLGGNGLYRPAVSPDGRVLAFQGTDHAIHFLDLASGKDLRRVPVWESEAVAFSPDGRAVAITGTVPSQPPVRWDEVVLQEVASGRVIRSFGRQRVPFAALAFSSDGHTLVTGSLDGTVRLWEAATGKERRRLEGHSGAITCLTFSANGRRLATTAEDRTTLIWSLTGEQDPAEGGKDLSLKEVETQWQALACEDAVRAYEAVHLLAAAPERSLKFLRQRLGTAAPDAGRLERLIGNLSGDDFNAREQAERDLEGLGMATEPALQRALAAKPSPRPAAGSSGCSRIWKARPCCPSCGRSRCSS